MGAFNSPRIDVSRQYRYPAKLAQPFIIWLFEKSIYFGSVRLQFTDEVVEIGSGKVICTIAPPSVLKLLWMMLRPDYRLPSQYTKGYWCCEEGKLYEFLELLNAQTRSPMRRLFKFFNRSPIRDKLVYRLFPLKVKENIASHYNTSPEFMRLILGEQLEYTCAFFNDEDVSLDTAQKKKIKAVIKRLGIKKSHRVLDLGCGWGQIAETVSLVTGAQILGLNITPNQIEHAHLNSNRLTEFVLSDYETFHSDQSFDRVYSIGMLEHIGRGKLKSYFTKIREFLKPTGAALVHCIVRKEKGSTNSWIDQEIFPGAYIPELSEIISEIEVSGLELKTLFAHDKSNYYKTLCAWLENFRANEVALREIMARQIGERDAEQIMRIWEFYLCGSRLVFNDSTGYCYNVQILMIRPQDGLQSLESQL